MVNTELLDLHTPHSAKQKATDNDNETEKKSHMQK